MSLTHMEMEAQQAPLVIADQFKKNKNLLKDLCLRLRRTNFSCVMTVARGSSDHAATFAKYLFEIILGLPTVSAAPSVFTLYHSRLKLKNVLVLAISQSGQSLDLCETLKAAREAGAITVALVNQIDSPLAKIAEYIVPLYAGEEKAVAATKSFLASLSALIALIAEWSNDSMLWECLQQLPEFLKKSIDIDCQNFIDFFNKINNTIVIGRGYGFAIAQEAALKFKETCCIQAEAFSSAEFLHGPLALIHQDYAVLVMAQRDPTWAGTQNLAEKIKSLGGNIFSLSPVQALHPACDPLINLQSFYMAIPKLAVTRGYNPDQPLNLNKVTITK